MKRGAYILAGLLYLLTADALGKPQSMEPKLERAKDSEPVRESPYEVFRGYGVVRNSKLKEKLRLPWKTDRAFMGNILIGSYAHWVKNPEKYFNQREVIREIDANLDWKIEEDEYIEWAVKRGFLRLTIERMRFPKIEK